MFTDSRSGMISTVQYWKPYWYLQALSWSWKSSSPKSSIFCSDTYDLDDGLKKFSVCHQVMNLMLFWSFIQLDECVAMIWIKSEVQSLQFFYSENIWSRWWTQKFGICHQVVNLVLFLTWWVCLSWCYRHRKSPSPSFQ